MVNTQLLTRRVEKILPTKEGLEKLIQQKGKIRLYQGIDPTASRLHLGHTVGIRKLMDFARLGHQVIMLFGTGTVLVGDPSERSTGRKLITEEEIQANIADWKQQVAPIADFDLITIKKNGDWLTKLTLKDIVHLASNITAVQLFKRQSFTRRIKAGNTVWYHETMYPLLQGYDSVVMDVDLEIGGTDQEFNMLIGRELQRKINHKQKYVLTTPMILGTDGGQMSKTTGNCVWLDDTPENMFGKLMSIPDGQIPSYLELLTDIDLSTVNLTQPLRAKKTLAYDITRQFHGPQKALIAQNHFENTIQHKQVPQDIPTITLTSSSLTLLEICRQALAGASSSHIKQTISLGGVQLNDHKIINPSELISVKSGDILKFGKRHFFRLNHKVKSL